MLELLFSGFTNPMGVITAEDAVEADGSCLHRHLFVQTGVGSLPRLWSSGTA